MYIYSADTKNHDHVTYLLGLEPLWGSSPSRYVTWSWNWNGRMVLSRPKHILKLWKKQPRNPEYGVPGYFGGLTIASVL